MNVLLIDTATRLVRVALMEDQKLIDSREWGRNPDLGKRLLDEIDGLLKRHNLTLREIQGIKVAPGGPESSFMALRTAVVVADMLAQGVGIKVLDKS